jgi:hypothetical protein
MIGAFGRRDAHLRRIHNEAAQPRPLPVRFKTTRDVAVAGGGCALRSRFSADASKSGAAEAVMTGRAASRDETAPRPRQAEADASNHYFALSVIHSLHPSRTIC